LLGFRPVKRIVRSGTIKTSPKENSERKWKRRKEGETVSEMAKLVERVPRKGFRWEWSQTRLVALV
jgi:SOS response regulatory protein OraA/RecX